MASPWKFLARLTLGRRQQTDQKGATDDVTSEQAVIAETVEAAGEKSLNSPDWRIDADAQSADRSDAVSAKPKHSEETNSIVEVATGRESAKLMEAGDPSLSGDAPRTGNRKSSNAGAAVSRQPPPRAPTFSDEVASLDEEIRLLRDHLTRKLQLQNAQLRKMLERFER